MRNRRRPIWRIRHELFWVRVFARLAGPGRDPADRYEINDELTRLFFELSAAYRAAGRQSDSVAAEHKAFEYALRGTPPEPPPAAAMGMPVPQPYISTDAFGPLVEGPKHVK